MSNPKSAGAAPAAPVLEPATQKFIDALAAAGGPPIYSLSPDAARDVLAGAQAQPVAKLPVAIEDTTFPVGPTGSVRIRIVRPQGASGTLPVVMHFHGGGWILGDKETHDRMTREIAVGADAAVVFVDYERSPEARYPVAIEQAYAATKYVAEHGKELGVDPTCLAIVGDSVGGNMAAAVTLMAKERGGPKIAFQVLFYPVTDANFDTLSYHSFADGPWLTRPAMEWFWNAYLPDVAARRQITATPLSASPDQLKGLPDALVIVDENDVLRDEGEAYARKLSQAGVRVTRSVTTAQSMISCCSTRSRIRRPSAALSSRPIALSGPFCTSDASEGEALPPGCVRPACRSPRGATWPLSRA